jgi:hypothetical protein
MKNKLLLLAILQSYFFYTLDESGPFRRTLWRIYLPTTIEEDDRFNEKNFEAFNTIYLFIVNHKNFKSEQVPNLSGDDLKK